MPAITPASTSYLLIRDARADDVTRMGTLGALLVDTHHGFDPRRFIAARPQTAEAYGSFLESQLEKPDVLLLVAEMAGHVIAYAFASLEGYDYMSLRGPAGVVHDLVVDPDHRRRGAGRALLVATLERFKARGAARVVLSTAERNEPAQRLFAALGFRRTMVEMTCELQPDA